MEKNLGMVFQIIDDLLDFSGDLQTMGKSPMTDFGNGVITLPIIYALKQPDFRDEIREIVDRRNLLRRCWTMSGGKVHQSGSWIIPRRWQIAISERAINNLKALPKNTGKGFSQSPGKETARKTILMIYGRLKIQKQRVYLLAFYKLSLNSTQI